MSQAPDSTPTRPSTPAKRRNALHETKYFAPGPPRSFFQNATSAVYVAAFGFFCVLAVGAVLVIGAKLQEPDLGAGASPLSIFNSIVVISMGATGAIVEVGDLTVHALPLGGLLFIALGIGWASGQSYGPHRSLEWSIAVGFLYALMCALAAGVCDIGSGAGRIFVRPENAFAATLMQGTLFSLIRLPGVVSAGATWKKTLARILRGDAAPGPGGLRAGLNLALWVLSGAAAAAALGVVVYATTRASSPFAALGIVVHALAFLPNLAIALVSFALGAPVEAGFGSLAATATETGSIPDYSLLDYKGGPAPAYLWLPAVCLGAALVVEAVRRWRAAEHGSTRKAVGHGLLSVVVFAWLLGSVAGAADARVGADLQTEGFLGFAMEPGVVFGLALVWAAVATAAGLALARRSTITEKETTSKES